MGGLFKADLRGGDFKHVCCFYLILVYLYENQKLDKIKKLKNLKLKLDEKFIKFYYNLFFKNQTNNELKGFCFLVFYIVIFVFLNQLHEILK